MTVLDWPGPWSMRVPQISPHKLLYDVVTLAQTQGMRHTGAELGRLGDYRRALQDPYPLVSDGRIDDPAQAGDLEAMARRAVDWLNEHAPPGRRFVLGDALYCEDLDTRKEPPPERRGLVS